MYDIIAVVNQNLDINIWLHQMILKLSLSSQHHVSPWNSERAPQPGKRQSFSKAAHKGFFWLNQYNDYHMNLTT